MTLVPMQVRDVGSVVSPSRDDFAEGLTFGDYLALAWRFKWLLAAASVLAAAARSAGSFPPSPS